MRTTLLIAAAVIGLAMAGLAFTAAVCLATGALVAVAYFLFAPWTTPGGGPSE